MVPEFRLRTAQVRPVVVSPSAVRTPQEIGSLLLTIFYVRTGERYGKGAGLKILANGNEIDSTQQIQRIRNKEHKSHSRTPPHDAPFDL